MLNITKRLRGIERGREGERGGERGREGERGGESGKEGEKYDGKTERIVY
jgi:hypothetical protein